MMKKLKILAAFCVLLVVLLWAASAAGTECLHGNLTPMGSFTQCQNVGGGHHDVEISTSRCEDCGDKVISKTYGQLKGHVFHMIESLHFVEDYMHVCVFLCPECSCITLRRYGCNAGSCYRYHAVGSQQLRVQYLNDYDAWNDTFTEEACIQRWLDAQKAEAE